MKARKLFWLFALSIMAVIFAACGGDAANGGGGEGGGDADASSAVELTQTETVDAEEFGGSISVSYPEGWVAQSEAGAIFVGTSEEALAIDDPTTAEIPEGAAIMNITVLPAEMGSVMGIEADASAADVLGVFTAFMAGDDMPEFSDVEEIDVDGATVATTTGNDENFTATIYAVVNDGTFVIGFGATRADEAGSKDAIFQAIVTSASFTAAE